MAALGEEAKTAKAAAKIMAAAESGGEASCRRQSSIRKRNQRENGVMANQ
jgi:hypothetical protein